MRSMDDLIARHGWAATGVFPCVGDEPFSPFLYTTGLKDEPATKGHDLIMVGFDGRDSHAILTLLLQSLKSGRQVMPEDEGILRDVFEGQSGMISLKVRKLSPLEVRSLCYQTEHHYGRPGEFLQVILPDKHGSFPGDEGVDPRFEARQDIPTLITQLEKDTSPSPH